MRSPKVSVCIPSYNYGRFLGETLASVLRQTEPDFEVIVVDDASTDNSREVISSYGKADPRVRAEFNDENLGMVRNWNRCLALARGKYVKFLLADDFLLSDHALERLASVLDQTPEVALVACARQVVDSRSARGEVWSWFPDGTMLPRAEVVSLFLLHGRRNLIGEPTAVMFRRCDALRGFDESYRQLVDLEMWFHLLGRGHVWFVEEPLCAFRVHEGSQTALNRRESLHFEERGRLLAECLRDRTVGCATRYFALCDHALQLGRLARRGRIGRDRAWGSVQALCSPGKLFLALPLYALWKPLLRVRTCVGAAAAGRKPLPLP
jgi:glycosyltransferase involved in cell wall biosynthesis